MPQRHPPPEPGSQTGWGSWYRILFLSMYDNPEDWKPPWQHWWGKQFGKQG